MKTRNIYLHIFFLAVVIIELISRWLENHETEYFAKPLLLVWIAVYYALNTPGKDIQYTLISAFAFSWIGDIFLMLAHIKDIFFFAGVGGFFFAQVFYIISFISGRGRAGKGSIIKQPVWLLPFLVYLVIMIWYLYPGLEGIMRPVIIVYGISLIGMSVAAFNRMGTVNHRSFILVFTGSVFFVLSDSMIAINKFQTEFPKASFIIVATYILAQYLILRGVLLTKD